jgi:hypothetical protein
MCFVWVDIQSQEHFIGSPGGSGQGLQVHAKAAIRLNLERQNQGPQIVFFSPTFAYDLGPLQESCYPAFQFRNRFDKFNSIFG